MCLSLTALGYRCMHPISTVTCPHASMDMHGDIAGARPAVARQREHNCSQLLTQSVSHGDNGSVVQLHVSNLVRQHHSQVGPPVSPCGISAALEGDERRGQVSRHGDHKVGVTAGDTSTGLCLLLTNQCCLGDPS